MSMKVMYDLKDMLCAELDEIGKKGEMTDKGLCEVPNPSALFLAERRGNISGSLQWIFSSSQDFFLLNLL